MTLMVALIGEQPLPNLLPVRRYQPDAVLLVYTERTKGVYERLVAMLKQETKVYGLETSAYDVVAIVKALDTKLEEQDLVNQTLIYNLTGGTKTMVLAAYQVAQRRKASMFYLQSEGKRNRIYYYTWANQQLQAPANELLPECVNLKDILDLHLGIGKWKENGPSNNEGGRFQAAVAEILRSQGYEIMVGISTMTEQIDIDVAIRFENQFGIIEAKAGDEGRKLHGIKQLSTAAQPQILGTYTKKFYAITVPASESHRALRDAANIRIISLQNYVGTDTLSPSDAKELITVIDEAFKGKME
jgi:hypothetical protein